MTNDEKQILAAELWKLSPPAQAVAKELLAKCADEFAADTTLNFLRGLPSLPMRACEVSKELIAKLNAAVQTLRETPAVWRSLDDLPHEIWRDICGYEGLYQVSNYGRVKSFQNERTKILSTYSNGRKNKAGYPYTSLLNKGNELKIGVHVLVARVFLPNPDNKPMINHIDANKYNDCVWNLEWSTQSENMQHASKMGLLKGNRFCKGSKSTTAKLNEDKVWQILEMYVLSSEEFGAKALAEIFGVTKGEIYHIVHGRVFKEVYAEFKKSPPSTSIETRP